MFFAGMLHFGVVEIDFWGGGIGIFGNDLVKTLIHLLFGFFGDRFSQNFFRSRLPFAACQITAQEISFP